MSTLAQPMQWVWIAVDVLWMGVLLASLALIGREFLIAPRISSHDEIAELVGHMDAQDDASIRELRDWLRPDDCENGNWHRLRRAQALPASFEARQLRAHRADRVTITKMEPSDRATPRHRTGERGPGCALRRTRRRSRGTATAR